MLYVIELVHWMHKQYHKLIYAEDILILNRASQDFSEISNNDKDKFSPYNFTDWDQLAKLYTIALPEGTVEVKRTETSRLAIFNNVRYGFAAAYNALVLDSNLKGKGLDIAKEIWPDSIVQKELDSQNEQKSNEENSTMSESFDTQQSSILVNENVMEKALLVTPALKLPKGKRKALIRYVSRSYVYILSFYYRYRFKCI